jgi:hypothetical protein
VQSEKFARRKPIFLTGLKGFLRLSNDLKFGCSRKTFSAILQSESIPAESAAAAVTVLRDDKPAPNVSAACDASASVIVRRRTEIRPPASDA